VKILITDDHAVVRQGLKRILGEEFKGATFGEAASSQEALDLVERQKWDVVILDLGLPGRSGLEVLKQLHAEYRDLPVIVFSMYPEEQFALRALKAGASGYLTKESAPDQMVAAVLKVVAGGRYVSPALAEKLAAELGRDSLRAPHEMLSDREFEILRMIGEGKTVSGIAHELSLSVKTVSTYRARILEKMQLNTTAELIRYVVERSAETITVNSTDGPKTMAEDTELLDQAYKAGLVFLKTEIDSGLGYARMALDAGTDSERKRRSQELARRAYSTVVRLGRHLHVTEADMQKLEQKFRKLKATLEQLEEV
jgi:DNA-binding NarL/FixJ family response regulator